MNIILIIASILIIALVLLQSGKAEQVSIIGGGSELFANRKERGGEKFITNLTVFLGALYMFICLIQGF